MMFNDRMIRGRIAGVRSKTYQMLGKSYGYAACRACLPQTKAAVYRELPWLCSSSTMHRKKCREPFSFNFLEEA